MQTLSEHTELLDAVLSGQYVHQSTTSVPTWLTKYTEEAALFAPSSKRVVAVMVTNKTGIYVLAGHRVNDAWSFTLLTVREHEQPWTSWGVQVDYRW